MKKHLLAVAIFLSLVTGVYGAGSWSAYNFSYKPQLTTQGTTDYAQFNISQDLVDATLKALTTNSEIWVGSPSYPTFAAAVATLNAAGTACTLRLPVGTHTVSADLTCNSNIVIKPDNGAVITVATGKILTINGNFEPGRYYIFSLTGTGKVIFGEGAVREVYPEWWGENTTPGTTDMAPMIQAAIDARAAWNGTAGGKFPIVSLANADYLINSALDLTTTYVSGTMQRDCVHISGTGYGGGGTRIIGNTGNLMLDTCGSNFIIVQNLTLTSNVAGLATPSVVGILQASLTANSQCQFHVYRNMAIDMGDDATANGNEGTIGIVNYGGESVNYNNILIKANRIAVLTSYDSFLLGVDSVYQPGGMVATFRNLGSVKISGQCNFWTYNLRKPAFLLGGLNDLNIKGELTDIGVAGTNMVIFDVEAQCNGLTIDMVTENRGTLFYLNSAVEGVKANVVMAVSHVATAPVIYVVANLGYLSESDLQLVLSATLTRDLITCSALTGSYFRNTTIKTTQAKANAITPLDIGLINNSTYKSFVIEATDARFDTNTRVLVYDPGDGATGFSSYTSENVWTSVNGDEVTVRFNLAGTSDADHIEITLPFAANGTLPTQVGFNVQIEDNGTWATTPGMIEVVAGSSTANVYKNGQRAAFTTSGNKAAIGELKYYRALTY